MDELVRIRGILHIVRFVTFIYKCLRYSYLLTYLLIWSRLHDKLMRWNGSWPIDCYRVGSLLAQGGVHFIRLGDRCPWVRKVRAGGGLDPRSASLLALSTATSCMAITIWRTRRGRAAATACLVWRFGDYRSIRSAGCDIPVSVDRDFGDCEKRATSTTTITRQNKKANDDELAGPPSLAAS